MSQSPLAPQPDCNNKASYVDSHGRRPDYDRSDAKRVASHRCCRRKCHSRAYCRRGALPCPLASRGRNATPRRAVTMLSCSHAALPSRHPTSCRLASSRSTVTSSRRAPPSPSLPVALVVCSRPHTANISRAPLLSHPDPVPSRVEVGPSLTTVEALHDYAACQAYVSQYPRLRASSRVE